MASSSSSSLANTVQSDLFPPGNISYIGVKTKDGKLFMFDRNIGERSETLRSVFNVYDSLHAGEDMQAPSNVVDIDVSSAGFVECLELLAYTHRWYNEADKKIPSYAPLDDSLNAQVNAVVASKFLGL